MPPVLAQMDRYLVGPGQLRNQSRRYRIRFLGPSCLPDGGDVIDIYP
jgi:hypothetical protein